MKIRWKPEGILSPVRESSASIAVVYDSNGVPLCVIEEIDSGVTVVSKADDAGFPHRLRMCGICGEDAFPVSRK